MSKRHDKAKDISCLVSIATNHTQRIALVPKENNPLMPGVSVFESFSIATPSEVTRSIVYQLIKHEGLANVLFNEISPCPTEISEIKTEKKKRKCCAIRRRVSLDKDENQDDPSERESFIEQSFWNTNDRLGKEWVSKAKKLPFEQLDYCVEYKEEDSLTEEEFDADPLRNNQNHKVLFAYDWRLLQTQIQECIEELSSYDMMLIDGTFLNRALLDEISKAIFKVKEKEKKDRAHSFNDVQSENSRYPANTTILFTTVEALRRQGLNIRQSLSWEQLISETLSELRSIPTFGQFDCVVVLYDLDGALTWFGNKSLYEVILDPESLEGSLASSQKEEATFYSSLLLQCGVLCHFLNALDEDDDNTAIESVIEEGVRGGVYAARSLFRSGFKKYLTHIAPPYDELLHILINSDEEGAQRWKCCEKSLTRFEATPDFTHGAYSIIRDFVPRERLYQVALNYVKGGKPTMHHTEDDIEGYFPYLEIGNLITYERKEIEQLNNLKNMLASYHLKDRTKQPLSVCVFGSPGAGKSFAVKEIAKSLGISDTSSLEFNLSQMSSYEDLAHAFHRVANAGLKETTPLVFFDEFDSMFEGNELGWLKYFLAPMQDGLYREGRFDYGIGKAIFVFAGGTSSCYADFLTRSKSARNAKAKDFLSRIKCYIDILGINPKAGVPGKIPYIKRAVLLRSLILREMGIDDGHEEQIDIEESVLEAFLKVPEYYHDARSMQAIIHTSKISRGERLVPSSINNNSLNLHVPEDFQNFLRHDKDVVEA